MHMVSLYVRTWVGIYGFDVLCAIHFEFLSTLCMCTYVAIASLQVLDSLFFKVFIHNFRKIF